MKIIFHYVCCLLVMFSYYIYVCNFHYNSSQFALCQLIFVTAFDKLVSGVGSIWTISLSINHLVYLQYCTNLLKAFVRSKFGINIFICSKLVLYCGLISIVTTISKFLVILLRLDHCYLTLRESKLNGTSTDRRC